MRVPTSVRAVAVMAIAALLAIALASPFTGAGSHRLAPLISHDPAAEGTPGTTPAPVASPPDIDMAATVPMLGTKPPPGLVLPSYFVTVTSSSNGAIAVLTTPASRCGLDVHRPSGATIDPGARIADANGVASWTYPALSDRGESILTVRCTLGDEVQTAKARVLLP